MRNLTCDYNTIQAALITVGILATAVMIWALKESYKIERCGKKFHIGAGILALAFLIVAASLSIGTEHMREVTIHGPVIGTTEDGAALVADMEGTFTVHGLSAERIAYLQERGHQSSFILHQDRAGVYHYCQE